MGQTAQIAAPYLVIRGNRFYLKHINLVSNYIFEVNTEESSASYEYIPSIPVEYIITGHDITCLLVNYSAEQEKKVCSDPLVKG